MPGYVDDFGNQIINASIFVLSSNYEGMPNALMEAMALGIPCVATNCPIGGPEFLINNESNGILVSVNNEEEMFSSIEKIIIDKNFAETVGNNARCITNTLSSDKIYNEWEEYILYQTHKSKLKKLLRAKYK